MYRTRFTHFYTFKTKLLVLPLDARFFYDALFGVFVDDISRVDVVLFGRSENRFLDMNDTHLTLL